MVTRMRWTQQQELRITHFHQLNALIMPTVAWIRGCLTSVSWNQLEAASCIWVFPSIRRIRTMIERISRLPCTTRHARSVDITTLRCYLGTLRTFYRPSRGDACNTFNKFVNLPPLALWYKTELFDGGVMDTVKQWSDHSHNSFITSRCAKRSQPHKLMDAPTAGIGHHGSHCKRLSSLNQCLGMTHMFGFTSLEGSYRSAKRRRTNLINKVGECDYPCVCVCVCVCVCGSCTKSCYYTSRCKGMTG